MGNNLHAASSQWASRPADERFWNLHDMRLACEVARANSATANVSYASLRAEGADGDVRIIGSKTGQSAKLTHYAFGQLATSVSAPAGYLRELPSDVAAQCLNAGIAKASSDTSLGSRNILFHKNGGLTARAILSDRYDRVWDDDVCRFLERLTGWKAPAGRHVFGESRIATSDDILPGQINIRPGDAIGPAGLYASDHDMFAFLVAPDRVISDGADGALMRGIFVRNSEVGDAALSVTFFLMQAVCGNHIVWNATGVHEIRVHHVGDNTMRRALRGFEADLRRFHDAAPEEERGILAARRLVLGNTKEEVLDAVVKYAKSHSLALSRKRVDEGYEIACQHEAWYGNPRSLWGVVAGLTHGSQSSGFADERSAVDRAAGQLLKMAF